MVSCGYRCVVRGGHRCVVLKRTHAGVWSELDYRDRCGKFKKLVHVNEEMVTVYF